MTLRNDISRRVFVSIISVLTAYSLQAQSGFHSFNFIDIPTCPRVTGLGGVNITLSDGNMFLLNPAMLSPNLSGQVSFNHYFYYAGIRYNSMTYIHDLGKSGTWGIGIQQAGYGVIDSYDPSGNSLGQVQAGEYALVIGNAHKSGNFTIGVNIKIAVSGLASYRASAFLTDIGCAFRHPHQDLTAAIIFYNLGFIIKDYTQTSGSEVPFDVRAGISFKPEHMPFRFSATLQKLNQGNIPYFNGFNGMGLDKPGNFDKIFSHVVVGTELIINKNLSFFGGYNHLIRKELRLQEISGGAGFSYGLLISIKAFALSYASAIYQVAGGTHHLGLSVNLSSMYKRKPLN